MYTTRGSEKSFFEAVSVYRGPISYLEELYANDGEHELQEAGDEDYVSDSLYRYDDALYYVLGSQH